MATMALTADGNLYARFFIELGPMEVEITPNPPIPPPTGSITFDDFESYATSASLYWLNSGSNEWDNKTALAAWVARTASYANIREWDNFTTYTVSSSLSASLAGSGSGPWSGVYDYYGRYAWNGIKYFDYMVYTASTFICGSMGGEMWNNETWAEPWLGKSIWTGTKAYDNFSTYVVGNPISESNDQPDPRYQDFSSPWTGKNTVSASS